MKLPIHITSRGWGVESKSKPEKQLQLNFKVSVKNQTKYQVTMFTTNGINSNQKLICQKYGTEYLFE